MVKLLATIKCKGCGEQIERGDMCIQCEKESCLKYWLDGCSCCDIESCDCRETLFTGIIVDLTDSVINIKDIYNQYYEKLASGQISDILLLARGTLLLSLASVYFVTDHRGKKNYTVIIKVYDQISRYGFQYSHPLPNINDDDFSLDRVKKFYTDWKSYFDNWSEALELELMECCGYKKKVRRR